MCYLKDISASAAWLLSPCQHNMRTVTTVTFSQDCVAGIIGSILNPLAGKLSEDTRKEGKGAKTGASDDWRSFYLSQYLIG